MDVTVQYEFISELINKQKLNQINWDQYAENVHHVSDFNDWKYIYKNIIVPQKKEIGLAYRYRINKGFFVCVVYCENVAYILSDQGDLSEDQIGYAIAQVCATKKVFLWNLKHFMKRFFRQVKHEDIGILYKNVTDTQILSYLITLKKDGGIKDGSFLNSEYHKKIRTMIDKVYKNDEYYYYLPRNILTSSMIQEAVAAQLCGKLFLGIAQKMNMTRLLNRLQLLNIALSDIESGSFKVNVKRFSELINNGLTIKGECANLLKHCHDLSTDYLPIEYKALNSTTGRLTFSNKTGVNMLSYPKDRSRELIIPEFDKFVMIDVKGMEVFYQIMSRTDILTKDDVKIDENFDIYNYIIEKIEHKIQRAKLKNTVIKWFYGATNFTEEEEEIKRLITENIPEIVPKRNVYVPVYYQTSFGRVIKVNKSYTKYQNNIPQSEANDVMIDCVVKMWNKLKKDRMKSKIKFIIHDSVIFDCVDDEVDRIKEIIHEVFKGQFPYECKVGNNWMEVS